MKARGFTLVELVMVIVITGILAATLTIFLKPAIDSYFDTRRRADLTDIADTALRRMAQDIRRAVPNSVRSVSPTCLQLVPTIAGGRYRMAPDTTVTTSQPIDTSVETTLFDALSVAQDSSAAPLDVGDWVVIDSQDGDEVYTNLLTDAGPKARITSLSQAVTEADKAIYEMRIGVAAKQFPVGYGGGRFVIVPDAQQTVFYSLNTATRTLYRGTVRSTANTGEFTRLASQAACDAAGGEVVATDVASATFIYDPNQGATQQSGFVWMRLELSREGEGVALGYGVHVDNVP